MVLSVTIGAQTKLFHEQICNDQDPRRQQSAEVAQGDVHSRTFGEKLGKTTPKDVISRVEISFFISFSFPFGRAVKNYAK